MNPISLALAFVAAVPFSMAGVNYSKSVDTGGAIETAGDALVFSIPERNSESPGRAELRGPSSRHAVSATGELTIRSGGERVSVAQVVNVRTRGAQGGQVKPIAQLAIQRDADTGLYDFYIVQGGKACRDIPSVKVGEMVKVEVSARHGSAPVFVVNGNACSAENPRGDRAGIFNAKRSVLKNQYFFAKLGAYNTSTGKGATVVEWRRVSFAN